MDDQQPSSLGVGISSPPRVRRSFFLYPDGESRLGYLVLGVGGAAIAAFLYLIDAPLPAKSGREDPPEAWLLFVVLGLGYAAATFLPRLITDVGDSVHREDQRRGAEALIGSFFVAGIALGGVFLAEAAAAVVGFAGPPNPSVLVLGVGLFIAWAFLRFALSRVRR